MFVRAPTFDERCTTFATTATTSALLSARERALAVLTTVLALDDHDLIAQAVVCAQQMGITNAEMDQTSALVLAVQGIGQRYGRSGFADAACTHHRVPSVCTLCRCWEDQQSWHPERDARCGCSTEHPRAETASTGRPEAPCACEAPCAPMEADRMPPALADRPPRVREGTPHSVVETTLYDLMAAVQDALAPGEEACVVPIVAHLLRAGRAQWRRDVQRAGGAARAVVRGPGPSVQGPATSGSGSVHNRTLT